ncbi:hypothetical protein CAOG_02266 [Capsaspora owczarzaki ATCC 30864]|uniref:Tetratricopeptide repeat protein 7 N-terminal domain-containing protein n=1 Tax=Capsaspora owczarzaki (strain ATCC 30864) TaxID=595528 RepID=A0A0D2X1M6_CAPO3|nr:hypothetical protein CAOG_02266 [Capsaspora owczarzaki ATCC 30864]KJE91074.1 hypothetical protein CAOG_002266 [Capsaspora owczarzaki ATCC 30864]|eukprot:XP_004349016.1 hypothetical protein CAOG_02266 [Capsaspora owczarzaki ATCC 30864]
MSAVKATPKTIAQLQSDIERVRLAGHWTAIPELVERHERTLPNDVEPRELLIGERFLVQHRQAFFQNLLAAHGSVVSWATSGLTPGMQLTTAGSGADAAAAATPKASVLSSSYSPLRASLAEAIPHLERAASQQRKEDSSVMVEAQLVLAQVYYSLGDSTSCERVFGRLDLEEIFSDLDALNRRTAMLGAEALVCRGLVKERLASAGTASPAEAAELQREALKYFNRAVLIATKKFPASPGNIGFEGVMTTALFRVPALYLEADNVSKCIETLRRIIRLPLVSQTSTRQLAMRRLSDVLLYTTCETTYTRAQTLATNASLAPATTGKGHSRSLSTGNRSISQDSTAVPGDEVEDALLLLLLEEVALQQAIEVASATAAAAAEAEDARKKAEAAAAALAASNQAIAAASDANGGSSNRSSSSQTAPATPNSKDAKGKGKQSTKANRKSASVAPEQLPMQPLGTQPPSATSSAIGAPSSEAPASSSATVPQASESTTATTDASSAAGVAAASATGATSSSTTEFPLENRGSSLESIPMLTVTATNGETDMAHQPTLLEVAEVKAGDATTVSTTGPVDHHQHVSVVAHQLEPPKHTALTRLDHPMLPKLYEAIVSVYDRIAILCSRRKLFGVLVGIYERSLKFSYRNSHLWLQFALVLLSAGHYRRASHVLCEACQLHPGADASHMHRTPADVVPLLLGASVCFNSLDDTTTALEFAFAASSVVTRKQQPLDVKTYQVIGLSYRAKASHARFAADRKGFQTAALQALHKAHLLDKGDANIARHLALAYADIREMPLAIRYCQLAIQLNPGDHDALHLMALILSSQREYGKAIQICDAVLATQPAAFAVLLTKASLQLEHLGALVALDTYAHMLKQWRDLYLTLVTSGTSGALPRSSSRLLHKLVADGRSTVHKLGGLSATDQDGEASTAQGAASSSAGGNEAASSRAGDDGSTVGGANSVNTAAALHQGWLILIWVHIAKTFITLEKYADAAACLKEAKSLYPLLESYYFITGLVAEKKRLYADAALEFERALAIKPDHLEALIHMGIVAREQGDLVVAEKFLTEATLVDTSSHVAWHNLGTVLQLQQQHDRAVECFLLAVDLESTAPIVPFSNISSYL